MMQSRPLPASGPGFPSRWQLVRQWHDTDAGLSVLAGLLAGLTVKIQPITSGHRFAHSELG